MKITAAQKLKVLGFAAFLGLGLIACGGGGGGGTATTSSTGSTTSTSSGSPGTNGIVNVINSTSVDIGFVYIRVNGTSAWGTDYTNTAGGTASGVWIAPGETLNILNAPCNQYIDLRAEDYSTGVWQRDNYYLDCSVGLNWTLTDGSGGGSSTTSSGGGTGDYVHVWAGPGASSAVSSITVQWDGSTKGTMTTYYVTGQPTTCGVDGGSSEVTFTSTAGTHSLFAYDQGSTTWGPQNFTKTAGVCYLIELL